MVQCRCLLAERELCIYMSSADISYYNGSVLSSHRMICAWTPSTTDTVWLINQNTWQGCLKTTYPVLHAFRSIYFMCVEKKTPEESRGFGSTNRKNMLHQHQTKIPNYDWAWEEQQLRAHHSHLPWYLRLNWDHKEEFCIFWMFCLLQKVNIWLKKCHISHKSGH